MTAKKYHDYLKKRKWTGLLYRYLFVYPFFVKYLGSNNIDYGCGIVDFLRFSQYLRFKVHGLDVNADNVRACQRKLLSAARISDQSILQGSVDTIVLDNVLEHIKDPTETLNHIKDLLKRNGSLLVGVPVGDAGYRSDPDHKVYYDEKKLKDTLDRYGFEEITVFYRPFNSQYLRDNLRQYCFYAVYRKRVV
ncbi:MAG: class I SAM-dependent methyltransferase [Flavobacteriaceae bacterium]|jgi:SAM-dependent methyltransferase|nr:class I SAM-dependent methyltransferase [Flavobacteriaceae bacterium]